MTSFATVASDRFTRRHAIQLGATGLAGVAAFASTGELSPAATSGNASSAADRPKDKLRVASAQFPVSGNVTANADCIRKFMTQASKAGAHLLHTSEACLSGYASIDMPSFAGYDWNLLRKETSDLCRMAKELRLWLVLGSAHYLDEHTKPTNCLYLIDSEGQIVDRYDKSMCTAGDQRFYSAGNHLVTRDIAGVKIGLAICYDVCWPQIYIAYRQKGATVMLHSMHNARSSGPNCLDTLNVRQIPTRCADNRMWAVANNSSQPYSHWGSFVARPDATIAKQLPINEPGMLVHDFPDGLSEHGWYHNPHPMKLRDDEIMTWGTPSNHPRQLNAQAMP